MLQRWRWFLLVIPLISAALVIGTTTARADDGNGGGRYTEVETQYTEYTWQLISSATGSAICRVIIFHEGYPTSAEAIAACGEKLTALQQTPTETPSGQATPTAQPSPTLPDPGQLLRDTYWVLRSSREVKFTQKVALPEIIVILSVPPGPVADPVVTIQAIEPVAGHRITAIHGTANGIAFDCLADVCSLRLGQDVDLVYWASSSLGDESLRYSATLRISQVEQGYLISKTAASPEYVFIDSCANIWDGRATGPTPAWAQFPETPTELHTSTTLHYLAGRLIASGFVDASDCPNRGLLSNGFPDGCGLEKARAAMLMWQNRFDYVIWSAAKETGIPPRIIKGLIEQESQYWPGNARYKFYEYGLGQINEMGADSALRWESELVSLACSGLFFNCDVQYSSLSPYSQMMMAGSLVRQVDAECENCNYGIDLFKAEQSVGVFARILRANCRQTDYILQNQGLLASYEDLWRFTLLSYHGGYQCLEYAVEQVRNNQEPLNWYYLSKYLSICPGTKEYIESLWQRLEAYLTQPLAQPVLPTPEPIPILSPTRIAPESPPTTPTEVRVTIYMDLNNDQIIQDNERIDGMEVMVQFNKKTLHQRTLSGEVVFNVGQAVIGSELLINIPDLYRNYVMRVPENGKVSIVARLQQPPLPDLLP